MATITELSKYLYEGHKHAAYEDTCKMHDNLLIHSDGIYPGDLIEKRRPSETVTIKDYRKTIYKCQTMGSFGKVLNSIGKIRKSQDWSILYNKKIPGTINENETLQKYMEFNFPVFGSFTNWYFSHVLKQYLVDPNAVCCVHPLSFDYPDGEYSKPFPTIYNSENVIEYNEEMVLVKSEETCTYEYKNEKHIDGEIYYLYTKTEISEIRQIAPDNAESRYKIEVLSANPLGYIPARKIKAVFKKIKANTAIYESRLTQCLPHWDEAVREYSDLQAEVVQHIHSTLMTYATQKCKKCGGNGKLISKEVNKEGQGAIVTCDACKGGSIAINPYELIEQRLPNPGEPPLPSPIAQYLEKDTSIVEIQDERIDRHIYKGFAAINFEFLAVQLNQSGVAKELDRGELNAFIYDIAEDGVNFFDWNYKVSNDWRYITLIPSEIERNKLLPKINVPEKYDVFPDNYYVEQIDKARKGGMNSFIINALELQYANKAFSTDKDLAAFVKATTELDPLAGIADDQKLVRAQAGFITKTDFIISNYIGDFIRQALSEKPEFYTLELKEKKALMLTYAKEKEKQTTVADKFKVNDTRADNSGNNKND